MHPTPAFRWDDRAQMLAFVAEHVALAIDDERGRQAAEVRGAHRVIIYRLIISFRYSF